MSEIEKEEFWSRIVETYENDLNHVVGPDVQKAEEMKLATLTNLGNMVEFGCGTGKFTKVFAPNAETVLATDLSDEMLDVARKALADFPNVEVLKASVHDSGLRSNSFDSAVIVNALHLVRDPKAGVKEIYRILKPGGRMIVASFTGRYVSREEKEALASRFIDRFGKPPHAVNFTTEMVEEMMIEKGFDILESSVLGDSVKAVFVVSMKK